MKRNETIPIGELVRLICREQGLETPLNEYRLIQSWSEVLGPTIASYTKDIFIRNQILHVQLTSSVLRQELLMCRKRLIQNLNEHVGAQVITDIIFR